MVRRAGQDPSVEVSEVRKRVVKVQCLYGVRG